MAANATTEQQSREDLLAAGYSPEAARATLASARVLLPGMKARLSRTAEGSTIGQQEAAAGLEQLQREVAYNGGQFMGRDGKLRAPTESDGLNWKTGRMTIVDMDGAPYEVIGGPKKIAAIEQRLDASGRVKSEIGRGMDAYGRMERRIEQGDTPLGVGPGMPKRFQDLLMLAGRQDPDVAEFLSTTFLGMMDLIAAQQGARSTSDFDAKNDLANLPALSEIGSPAGRRKLEVQLGLLEDNRRALLNPAQAKRIQELNAQPKTLNAAQRQATDALDKSLARFTAERTAATPDPKKVGAAMDDLISKRDAWQATGADQKWKVVPTAPGVTPKAQGILDNPDLYPGAP
jgi:hypothetical protein